MRRLNVLITNVLLNGRTGTEIVVRDLALGLLRRGHRPIVYTSALGDLASELQARTVPVVDNLVDVGVVPDIIHGHHTLETAAAVLRFPTTPAVFVCHDWSAWHDRAPKLPRVRRFVAVDATCRDRLVCRHGIPAEAVRVIHNAVDLNRFTPREPLPARPRRAAVFGNYISDSNVLPLLQHVCRLADLSLDGVGANHGGLCAEPEKLLRQYDVVFAKGRCALEALAVGCAVILCDASGAGEMVVADNYDRLRPLNLGRRALSEVVTTEHLTRQLARYDAGDAARVSARVRSEAGLEVALDQWEALYTEVIAEHASAGSTDGLAESRLIGDFLLHLVPIVMKHHGYLKASPAEMESERLGRDNASLYKECCSLQLQLLNTRQEQDQMREQFLRREQDQQSEQQRRDQAALREHDQDRLTHAALQDELRQLRQTVTDLRDSTVVRLRERLMHWPLMKRVTSGLMRRLRVTRRADHCS